MDDLLQAFIQIRFIGAPYFNLINNKSFNYKLSNILTMTYVKTCFFGKQKKACYENDKKKHTMILKESTWEFLAAPRLVKQRGSYSC